MIENPDSPGQPTFRPQFPIRSADMREMWEQSRRAGRAAAWGNDGDNNAAGFQVPFDLAPVGFWARLTAPALSTSQALYNWAEVIDDGTGSGWTPPNALNSGTHTAFEVNNNAAIAVPGPPTSLTASLVAGGTLTVGTKYYWVVTANWTNTATGASLQSDLSNEVNLTPTTGNQTASLSWTAPAAATGFTLSGYSVWRGTSAGGENVLVTSGIAAGTTTYSDTGSTGSSQLPVFGGTAGPVVWLSPLATAGFWKFVYPPASTGGTTTQWVKVTSITSQTITIGTGTVTGYVAVLTSFNTATGAWVDTATLVWFYAANNEIPVVGNRYECVSFGTASDGKAVWGEDLQAEGWVKVTSATPSTITIGSTNVTAYPAVPTSWLGTPSAWSDSTVTAWFYPVSGDIPVAGNRYEVVAFGTAADGKSVWGNDKNTTTSFSGARFSNASLQSISSGIPTALSLSGATQDYDTDSYGALLTAPVDGYYRGFFQVLCPTAGSASYAVLLQVTSSGGTINAAIPSGGSHVQVVYEFHLTAGSTVQCNLTHNAGSPLNFRTEIAVIAMELIPGVVIDHVAHTITGQI